MTGHTKAILGLTFALGLAGMASGATEPSAPGVGVEEAPVAAASAATDAKPLDAASPHHHPRGQAAGLEDRVKTLSTALDLNEAQQAHLRAILTIQQQQVTRIWADSAVPAAYRVSATHAMSNRTADEIRAMLTDEQKAKFNPPPPAPAAPDPNGRSVADWIEATHSH
jgi:hypothetical protein